MLPMLPMDAVTAILAAYTIAQSCTMPTLLAIRLVDFFFAGVQMHMSENLRARPKLTFSVKGQGILPCSGHLEMGTW